MTSLFLFNFIYGTYSIFILGDQMVALLLESRLNPTNNGFLTFLDILIGSHPLRCIQDNSFYFT